ncbi:universal stress protein [Paraflavitalea pollutisoli]|uniref:universal stress protein n=1 Tax=Paraflavitalea pollutisoli TaxID=3034143 RepID=UPI0023EAA18B|nr:universal stress protein [Paraflavitalea sp. H1-2-19X]
MKTIIAATDLSATATNAALYAAEMAAAIDAELFLLHVYVPPVGVGDIIVPLVYDTWRKEAEIQMVALKRKILLHLIRPLHVRWEVRAGIYLTELKGACARLDPYTVVIGANGTSTLDRLLFGSHAITTMKQLPWPVICVPPDAYFSAIHKVALACDFEHVPGIVPFPEIVQLIRDFKAELHVLHIGPRAPITPVTLSGAEFLMDHLDVCHPQFHFLQQEDVDEGILDFVQYHGVDLLIVLPRRHRFLDALVHRSHTRWFVLHNLVPLMSLHGPKKRDGW